MLYFLLKEWYWYRCFTAGRGHYAQMAKTDTRTGYKACLVSPYINTTGKCLELFYWITQQRRTDYQQTLLRVYAISEEHTQHVLTTVNDLTGYFPRLYLRLPDGTHRIAIEGERSHDRMFCALSLDDLTIMNCDLFGKANAQHYDITGSSVFVFV